MTWQKATIAAMGALLVLFLTIFLNSVSAIALQQQSDSNRITALETTVRNQESLLREIRDELKDINRRPFNFPRQ